MLEVEEDGDEVSSELGYGLRGKIGWQVTQLNGGVGGEGVRRVYVIWGAVIWDGWYWVMLE